jgi:prephenate dehydratase
MTRLAESDRPAAPLRVAYQGAPGAYSEGAVLRYWRGVAEPLPVATFADVTRAVERGAVELGLLPFENQVIGVIAASCDALADALDSGGRLRVVGETSIPVRHCLLAPAGATIQAVTRVMSQPVALAQCGRFLSAHPWMAAVDAYDTAGAARDVAAAGDPATAAIASRRAAERYGLAVLAEGIEDRPGNRTRFLAVGATLAPTLEDGMRARTVLTARWASDARSLRRAVRRALDLASSDVAGEERLRARVLVWPAEGSGEEPPTGRALVLLDHAAGSASGRAAVRALASEVGPLQVAGTYAWPARRAAPLSRSRSPSLRRTSR